MAVTHRYLQIDRETYSAMVKRMLVIAGAMHAAWIPLYLALGAPVIAGVNLGSTAIYALCYWLLLRRRTRLAVGIAWAEVLAHAALGSLLLGWDSGFHYFVLVFIPVVILFFRGKVGVLLLGLLLVFYLTLDLLCQQIAPRHVLPWPCLLVARWVNIVLLFFAFYAMVYSYRRVIRLGEKQLQRIASTDPLSGLSNRAHFHVRAREEIERSAQLGRPVGLVLGDVDFFKCINDTHGHSAGDRVLVQLSALLQHALRDGDVIARWGGEEFIILLPVCDADQTDQLAERLRCAVEAMTLDNEGQPLKVTMSFGTSECERFEDLQSAISRADSALYQSKRAGRNRVTRHEAGTLAWAQTTSSGATTSLP